ncbi:MAG: ankyrin repeat domain-containing protein [Phycisphaerae bacterium]|jgi:cytohesin
MKQIVFVLCISIITTGCFAVVEPNQNKIAKAESPKEAINWEKAYKKEAYANQILQAYKLFNDLAIDKTRETLLSCSEELRGWEWYYLWNVSTNAGFWHKESNEEGTSINITPRVSPNSSWGLLEEQSYLGGALKILPGRKFPVECVHFSKDGKLLYSSDSCTKEAINYEKGPIASSLPSEPMIRVWDIETSKEIKQIKVPTDRIRSFCLNPIDEQIAISNRKEIIVTDLNGTILKKKEAHGKVSYDASEEISWSPDGRYIAFESRTEYDNAGMIEIWDIKNDKILHSISFKSDQENTLPNKRNSMTNFEYDIYSLVFSPDSKKIIAGINFSFKSNKTLRVLDVQTGSELSIFGDQTSIVTDLSISPDGKYIATCSGDSVNGDSEIKIWDMEMGKVKNILKGHSGSVESVSYSPDGKRIVTGSIDGTIKIWDADFGKELFSIGQQNGVLESYKAKFSPNGEKLAVWGGWSGFRNTNDIRILTASSKEDAEKWKQGEINKSQAAKQTKVSEEEDFLNAVRKGDKAKLKDYFVKEKYWGQFYSSPWEQAIKLHADANTFELLIEMGADVNKYEPLWKAVEAGDSTAVRVLVEHGAQMEAEGMNHSTPLHLAAKNGNREIVEYLIARGADINRFNDSDETPLVLALENGHLKVTELLINKGAEVNLEVTRNPLDYARKNGYIEIAKLIEEKGGASRNEIMKIFDAIKYGTIEQLQQILNEHPNFVNSMEDSRTTPIIAAVRKGKVEKVKLLIEKGAQLNLADKDGMAPIHHAAEKGEKEIIEILVKNGADINLESDEDECTALGFAISKRHKEAVEVLLNNGANINYQNNYPAYTPLHFAVKSDNNDIVQFLISKGADTNRTNSLGETPLHYAKSEAMKQILILNGGINLSDLTKAIKDKNCEKISEFLKRSPCLANSGLYETSLEKAIKTDDIEIVKMFLDAGADVNIKNGNGRYPLEESLEYDVKDANIAMLLIDKGANINVSEWYSQKTPLHTAIERGNVELVRMLLDKGADTNKKCINYGTPLNMAMQLGKLKIVAILNKHGNTR